MTSVCQGLSSLALWGGKMRDPGNEVVANGKRETARLGVFFASPRHVDFLDCETETSKCFECERETFRLLIFEPQI